MKIEPLADQICVRPTTPEEKTAGGILLPDRAQEKKSEGVVVAVGPGRYAPETGSLIPMVLKVNDRVIHSKYAGTEIEVDGETLLVIRENDALVKLV